MGIVCGKLLIAYLEESSDQVSLRGNVLVTWEGEELGESLVGWGENSDVLGLGKSSNDLWLTLKKS